MNIKDLQIRKAKIEDAKDISSLCQQLGYSISKNKVQAYLESLDIAEEWIVYVACQFENSILGWINLYLSHGLLADRQAEIGGLIVGENFRGNGIGYLLIQKAQLWAQQQGCTLIQVRSQTIRQKAHNFYQNIGFKPCKTQLVLRKQLDKENSLLNKKL